MQSPLLFLLATLMLLAPATADDLPTRPFNDLNPAEQQSLMRHWLVDRFDTAAPLALDEAERLRLSRKYAAVLRRMAAGDSLSTAGYRQLQAELAEIEQAAIDQLSLRYRVLVYNRLRTNRAEYERRMAEWRRLLASWKASGMKVAQGYLVIEWLSRSLGRLQYDEIAQLPALPSFEEPRAAPVPPALPSGGPAHPDVPDITRQRQATPPADTAPLDHIAVPPPMPQRPQQLIDRARNAHRVAKPPIPAIVAPSRTVRQDVAPVIAPPEAPPRLADSPAEPPVMIDLEELGIRVRGYNLALKDLLAGLHGDTVMTTEQLEHTFAQFEDLAARRAQIVLYRNLLAADDRQLVGDPLPLDTAIALLGGKIFAARASLASDGEAIPASHRLQQLDLLSRKLAQLAVERDP